MWKYKSGSRRGQEMKDVGGKEEMRGSSKWKQRVCSTLQSIVVSWPTSKTESALNVSNFHACGLGWLYEFHPSSTSCPIIADNLPKCLAVFGVRDGTRLLVDDFLQNYKLILNIVHRYMYMYRHVLYSMYCVCILTFTACTN